MSPFFLLSQKTLIAKQGSENTPGQVLGLHLLSPFTCRRYRQVSLLASKLKTKQLAHLPRFGFQFGQCLCDESRKRSKKT